jgi:hypothetical protein
MLTHVERRRWWTQLPFSRGVEVALAFALVAGGAVAAAQVRGRDATIADQAAAIDRQAVAIGRQAIAIRQAEVERRALSRLAELDAALIGAQDARANARSQGERALAAADYQGWEAALIQEGEAQSRIDRLLVQREVMSYTPPT